MMRISLKELPRVHTLGQIRQPGGWISVGRRLVAHMIVFLQQGDMNFRFGGQSYPLSEGEYLLIPSGTAYSASSQQGCQYHFVHFEPLSAVCQVNEFTAAKLQEQREESFSKARGNSTYALPMDGHEMLLFSMKGSMGEVQEKIWLLLTECDMYRYEMTPNRKTYIDIRFAEILNLLDQGTQKRGKMRKATPNVLSQMLLYIHQHYNEAVTLTDLSERFRISKQYVMMLFREQLGLSVTQYINRLKLEHSLDLLRYSTFQVNEIAEILGFGNAYYFCRLFKRQFLITPSEYRRQENSRE